jgi:hypothetical protein
MFTKKDLFEHEKEMDIYKVHNNFRVACRTGNLELATALYMSLSTDKEKQVVHSGEDAPFREACLENRLSVMIWLIHLHPEIDHKMWDEWCFRIACYNGYIDMATWLANYWKEAIITNDYPRSFRRAMRTPLSILKKAEYKEDKLVSYLNQLWTSLSDEQKREYYKIYPHYSDSRTHCEHVESKYGDFPSSQNSRYFVVDVNNSKEILELLDNPTISWAPKIERDKFGYEIVKDPVVLRAIEEANAILAKKGAKP